MYLSDMHTHSIASGHGTTCTISDMAKAASKKGLKLLGITDHGPGTLAAINIIFPSCFPATAMEKSILELSLMLLNLYTKNCSRKV